MSGPHSAPPLGRFHLDHTFYGHIAGGVRGTLLVNSLYLRWVGKVSSNCPNVKWALSDEFVGCVRVCETVTSSKIVVNERSNALALNVL